MNTPKQTSPKDKKILEERIMYVLRLNGGEMTYGDLLNQMRDRGWVLTKQQERQLR